MKKKILLFASAVLAAMTLTATAAFAGEVKGDVNNSGAVDMEDSALILKQALSKDFATSADAVTAAFDLESANLDEDKPFANTGEITANDAALAYKLFMNETALNLELRGQVMPTYTIVLEDGMDTKVKDVVEYYIDKESATVTSKFSAGVEKVKFGYTSDGKHYDAKLVDKAGWNIFVNALQGLLVEPVYKDGATIKELAEDTAGLDNATATKIAQYSLPTVTNNGADLDKIDAAYIKDAYYAALEVVNLDPTAAALIEAKNNVIAIAGDKYVGSVVLTYEDKSKTYTTADASADEFINALGESGADLYHYNDVTVGQVYKTFAGLVGVEEGSQNADGEYGTVTVRVNKRDIDIVLIEK